MIIDNIPLRANINKKHWQWLNFNKMLKNSYYTNQKLSRNFFRDFRELCAGVDGVCPSPPVELQFVIFRQNRDQGDLANIYSAVNKFTEDALVKCGFIPNDSPQYVKKGGYEDGGIDKQNPRACLEIKKYVPKLSISWGPEKEKEMFNANKKCKCGSGNCALTSRDLSVAVKALKKIWTNCNNPKIERIAGDALKRIKTIGGLENGV